MPWTKPYRPLRNQRLDATHYTYADHVYFMTIRAYQHQSPFVRDGLNKVVLDTLREEQERQNCAVYTYCLMPDHLHFLLSPREDGISVLTFANRYKGKATNRSWKVGWQGKLWQPRYYDHIVRHEESLRMIAEYILDNPVRQDLAERAEEWPWSGHMNPLPI